MHHAPETRLSRRHAYAALIAAVLWLAPVSADAQAPPVKYLENNQGTSGFLDSGGVRLRTAKTRGIKAGNFLIWPSLILEGRYDTNLFLDGDTEGEGPKDAPVLRVMPGFAVSNPNPRKYALTLAADADLRVYLSGDTQLTDLTNVGARGDFKLEVLPRGPVSVTVQNIFRRVLYPASISLDRTYNNNNNRAGAKLNIHPGGGALDIGLGYLYVANFFDDYSDGNWMSHDVMFRTTWRFYPKTIAFLEATASIRDWDHEAEFDGFYVDNMNLRTYLGLSGFITKKLATIVKAGYGNSFHDAGPSFEHVVAQGELSYKFSSSVLMAAGFLRDYRPAYYSNWFVENRTYFRTQLRFARRVSVDLAAAYSLVDYAEFDPEASDPELNQEDVNRLFVSHKERRDQHIRGHVNVSFDITRWIGMSLGYEVRANLTNFVLTKTIINSNGASFGVEDPGDYVRHQVYGSVNVRY